LRRGTLPAGQLSLVFKWLPVGGKGVFEITVEIIRLGENAEPKTALRYKKRGVCAGEGAKQETGIGIMFTLLQRVAPVAGLAIALFATVAWIGLVGYTLIKLF
jgi:hypothetical protein